MGVYIKSKYVDKLNFLSNTYNVSSEEIYIQTTAAKRTIDSAVSQLQGLFNQSLTFPKTDGSYQLNTVPLETDLLLKVDANCPRFIEIQNYAAADPAINEMKRKVSLDMETDFFPRLRKMTNMTDASTDELLDVCTYLYWAF